MHQMCQSVLEELSVSSQSRSTEYLRFGRGLWGVCGGFDARGPPGLLIKKRVYSGD